MQSKKLVSFTLMAGLVCSSFSFPMSAFAEETKASEAISQSSDNLLAQSLLKQAGKTYDRDDKVTVLLEVNDKVMNEKHNLNVPEIDEVRTKKGLNAQLNYAEKSQEKLIKAIDDLGVDFEVKERFDTLFNGVAVEMRLDEALEVTELAEVNSVELNRVIPKPLSKGLESFYMKDKDSNAMIGGIGSPTWQSKYTGKGQFIAIIDSGADPEHEIFKTIDMSGARFKSKQEIEAHIQAKGVSQGIFFNNKIPFGYNYADRNTKIKEDNQRSHGMHVAGIVAANSDKLKGVAPDAQLAIMRVFSDSGLFGGGTTPAIYNKAIDDAVKLGVDSINMSIGSTGNTDSRVDIGTQSLLKDAKRAGIIMSVAAGNDGFMGWGALEHPGVSNPDYGLMNSPAVNEISMAVASVNNSHIRSRSMVVSGSPEKRFAFAPSTTGELSATPVNFVYAGHGEPHELNSINLTGKYALISRGPSEKAKQSSDPKIKEGLSFGEKIKNVEEKGAVGAIVFDNIVDGELLNMAGLEEVKIPSCFISNEAGEHLKKNPNVTIYFDKNEEVIVNPKGYQLSAFSSWGLSAEGNLKPDISAPGGGIYSSINDNHYEIMNGTSMAAPHVAGGIAVTKQYVEKTFPEIVGEDKYHLVKNLLMSTAQPHKDKSSKAYTSPRGQGAGLMRVDKATTSEVTVEGTNNIASINLRDITSNTVTIEGKLHNYGKTARSYNYYAVLNTDSVEKGKILLKPRELASTENAKKQITVAPNSTQAFLVTFNLDSALATELLNQMPKGFFLEGFVFFDSVDGAPDLSIPYVGFKGNWTNLSVIEESIYDLVAKNERPYYYERTEALVAPFTHLASKNAGAQIVLGQAPDSTFEQPNYKKESIAISPNGDGKADDAKFVATFLRNYKDFELAVFDEKDTARKNPIYQSDDDDNFGLKNFFMAGIFGGPNTTTSKALWFWDGKLSTGEIAPEGNYVFEIKAKADGLKGDAQVMEIPIKLDLTFPRIVQSRLDEEKRIFEITKLEESGSGIRQVRLKNGEQELSPTKDMYFEIPAGIKLSDIVVEVMDNAFNAIEIPLFKAVRTGNERMIVVTPKISVGSVTDNQFSWKVQTLDGKEADPYNLAVGNYELVVSDVDERLELIGPSNIPFSVGEKDYNKIIEVPFRYQNRVEVIIPVENPDKAGFKLILLDKSTSAEYEIRQGNRTSNYIGYVPAGDYKIVIRDLDENFLAFTPSGNTIKVNPKGTGAPTIGVKIITKEEDDTIVNLVRGDYKGPAEVVLYGTDVNKTTYTASFSADEVQKVIKVAYPVKYEVFARNLEGNYGSKRTIQEVSGRKLKVTVEIIADGEKQDIPIDKDALELKLNYVENLKEEDYVLGWDELLVAKDEAEEVFKNPKATQEEVTTALKNLEEAIAGLQKATGDGASRQDLANRIKEAEEFYNNLNQEEYTESSLNFLIISIEAGKMTLRSDDPAHNTPEHLAAQIDLIDRALKNLTRKDGKIDKSTLMLLIKKVETILENEAIYTSESLTNLKDFYESAKATFESETARKDEVESAERFLQEALDALVANTNKADLEFVIAEADEILKVFGEYELSGKREFRKAYRLAKTAFDKGATLQEEVDKAVQALKEAIGALKKKEKPQEPEKPSEPDTPGTNPPPVNPPSNGGSSGGGGGGITLAAGSSINSENQRKDNHQSVMSGYPNGEFRPNEKLTRAEVAVMFARLGKLKAGKASFADVDEGKWYTDAISALVENGISSGYQDGTFKPNKPVTRAEFVSMLVRLKGEKLSGSDKVFKDSQDAPWAFDAISYANSKAWVGGYLDGTFRPNQSISRAEGALILTKAFNLQSEGSSVVFKDVDSSHWAYQAIRAIAN